jgi:biotin carboxylase
MPRILLLATTTGYQTRAFDEAAERLGFDLAYATDRCTVLDNPWRDQAIAIRFPDEEGSVRAIIRAAEKAPIDGILTVGDRPTVIAAEVARALGIPLHLPDAAAAARNKRLTRERLRLAGLLTPWFRTAELSQDPRELLASVTFPCVVKPLALSGSRGVIRANDEADLVAAFYRLRALMQSPDIRVERNPDHDHVLLEGFIPGREFAVEGLLTGGQLQILAIFDKPDPLDGPFFEETLYITPSLAEPDEQMMLVSAVTQAARAIGLHQGPIHAECRLNEQGVYVLEIAARPIGGLCARTLRFTSGNGTTISLEELLLRHSIGRSVQDCRRESRASGVMMLPIPRRGILRRVSGIDAARAVPDIDDVRITAKIDQLLVPLPEGASYLGFIFASADGPRDVDRALRSAHRCLGFTIDPEVRVLQSIHG